MVGEVTEFENLSLELDGDRRIKAYNLPGKSSGDDPCVAYVPGFMSNGKSIKGTFLGKFCSRMGYEFISYDPEGLGQSAFSAEKKWADIQFKHWVEDCERALKITKNRRIVLVGSSMGSWISMLMAQRHAKISALLLLAPAQNFISYWSEKREESLFQDEGISRYVNLKKFVEGSKAHEIPLTPKSLKIHCPVRIIHGYNDEIIPVDWSKKLFEALDNTDVQLTIIKNEDHSLNLHENLICDTLKRIIESLREDSS